jgi:hypothetical protein
MIIIMIITIMIIIVKTLKVNFFKEDKYTSYILTPLSI